MFEKHYTLGFSATFFSTVYPTCIGHYNKYGGKTVFSTYDERTNNIDLNRSTKTIDGFTWVTCRYW